MAIIKAVSDVTTMVNNLEDPLTEADNNATVELLLKANQACYWGNSHNADLQFDGLAAQMLDWCLPTSADGYGLTEHDDIFFDAGGAPLSRYVPRN